MSTRNTDGNYCRGYGNAVLISNPKSENSESRRLPCLGLSLIRKSRHGIESNHDNWRLANTEVGVYMGSLGSRTTTNDSCENPWIHSVCRLRIYPEIPTRCWNGRHVIRRRSQLPERTGEWLLMRLVLCTGRLIHEVTFAIGFRHFVVWINLSTRTTYWAGFYTGWRCSEVSIHRWVYTHLCMDYCIFMISVTFWDSTTKLL